MLVEVSAPSDDSALLAGASELASDVLDQFGIGTLQQIREPDMHSRYTGMSERLRP